MRTIKEGAYSYIPKEEISDIADYLIDALIAKAKRGKPVERLAGQTAVFLFRKKMGSGLEGYGQGFLGQIQGRCKSQEKEMNL